jgi:hypothetical protein
MFVQPLSWLVHAANADPIKPFWFYKIKNRVLKRYGKRIGWDQQHIVKRCWSCKDGVFSGYDNGWRWVSVPEQKCFKCNGTSVYDEFWVLLEVWTLGNFEFHRPVDRVRSGPVFRYPDSMVGPIRNKIEGRIKHRRHPHGERAFWVLAWVFTPRWAAGYKFETMKLKCLSIKYRISSWIKRYFYRFDPDLPF